MKFKTQYNSEEHTHTQSEGLYETPDSTSETIPNQSMTIKEIMARFASGLTIQGMKVPVYQGDDNLWNGIDPRTLDLAEVETIINERRKEMEEAKERVTKDVADRKTKAAEMRAKEIQRQIAEGVSDERSKYEKLKQKYDKTEDDGVN